MKPILDFVAERPLARHCPELLPSPRDPADRLPDLARLGNKLAPLLKARLSILGGDEALSIAALAVREALAADELCDGEALAVHWLLVTAPARIQVMVSAAAEPLYRMVDRAFGGRGQSPAKLPQFLSPTAGLFAARLGAIIAESLGEVLGDGAGGSVEQQGSVLAELSPFPPDAPLAVLECELDEPGFAPWTLRFALPLAWIGELVGSLPATERAVRGPADPCTEPFGDVPLTLQAVLVDMAVPMAAIATLQAGAMLPVAVSRQVPLRIGAQTVATGTPGTQDDRIALQLGTPALQLEIQP